MSTRLPGMTPLGFVGLEPTFRFAQTQNPPAFATAPPPNRLALAF